MLSAPATDPALSFWIRLMQTEGVGTDTARRLLTAFGMPDAIFAAAGADLRAVVSERIARALLAPPSVLTLTAIARTREWLTQPGHHVLTLADADYPPALLQIPDPPILLYVKGRVDLLSAAALAIVGSRNATAQGRQNSERFAEAVSCAGLTVVSGLALGIDAAAHQGGLRGVGSTVAVIGTGIDVVYPPQHRALAGRIAEAGCLVSEYPLGMPAIGAHFPRRNRLISGLARGVLVVEAAARSGSLITARMAAEQGRDVFAVPGSMHAPLAKGCHLLIKQGAKLVESAEDILSELGGLPAASGRQLALAEEIPADALLQAMGFDPVGTDMLSLRSGLDAAVLGARLMTLELEGAIECLPGGKYRRLH